MLRTVLAFLGSLSLAAGHMSISPDAIEEVGGYFRVAMRVPHGCGVGEGDARVYYPVKRVEVVVPEAIASQSMPRAEWIPFWNATSEPAADGTMKITWAADSPANYLPNEQFMEFGISMKVPPISADTEVGHEFLSYQICELADGEELVSAWEGEDAPMLEYLLPDDDGDEAEAATTTGDETPSAAPAALATGSVLAASVLAVCLL